MTEPVKVDRETMLKALGRRKSATPSEAVTWKRIGVPDQKCRGCGRKLLLKEVAHFGTTNGSRFVECADCMDLRVRPAE